MAKASLLISALLFSLGNEAAFSEDAYRWEDDRGRIHYSTEPVKGASRAELPEIEREDIDKRIDLIERSIPKNCLNRGGIDCSAGADTDGSVICVDGYRDAIARFRFNCLETSLDVQSVSLKLGEETLETSKSVLDLQKSPSIWNKGDSVSIAFRNTGDVVARKVKVYSNCNFEGPEEILGYGIGEFTAKLVPICREQLSLKEPTIDCLNCR